MHNTQEFGWSVFDQTHRPTAMTTKSVEKIVPKVTILILMPGSQNPFYVYWPKHDFLQIHNGRAKFWPSKTTTKDSSRFASSRALNCFPKADELFIANQTGVRVYVWSSSDVHGQAKPGQSHGLTTALARLEILESRSPRPWPRLLGKILGMRRVCYLDFRESNNNFWIIIPLLLF